MLLQILLPVVAALRLTRGMGLEPVREIDKTGPKSDDDTADLDTESDVAHVQFLFIYINKSIT